MTVFIALSTAAIPRQRLGSLVSAHGSPGKKSKNTVSILAELRVLKMISSTSLHNYPRKKGHIFVTRLSFTAKCSNAAKSAKNLSDCAINITNNKPHYFPPTCPIALRCCARCNPNTRSRQMISTPARITIPAPSNIVPVGTSSNTKYPITSARIMDA